MEVGDVVWVAVIRETRERLLSAFTSESEARDAAARALHTAQEGDEVRVVAMVLSKVTHLA